jgi:lipopolysaccharide export system protein LptA
MSRKKIETSRAALAAAGITACLFFAMPLFADTFSFRGDRMETVLAKGKERTILTGGAEVQTEENLIRAGRMELYGSDFRYISCRDDVQVINEKKELEASCAELFYDRREKVVRMSGNVVMLDKKNEIVVKGAFLESWENTDEAVAQIGVRILKKDLVCRSEFARYLRQEEKLELSGMPVVDWKGDEYRALKIFVDLKADSIRLEGEIRGRVTTEEAKPGAETPPAEAPGETPPGQPPAEQPLSEAPPAQPGPLPEQASPAAETSP